MHVVNRAYNWSLRRNSRVDRFRRAKIRKWKPLPWDVWSPRTLHGTELHNPQPYSCFARLSCRVMQDDRRLGHPPKHSAPIDGREWWHCATTFEVLALYSVCIIRCLGSSSESRRLHSPRRTEMNSWDIVRPQRQSAPAPAPAQRSDVSSQSNGPMNCPFQLTFNVV